MKRSTQARRWRTVACTGVAFVVSVGPFAVSAGAAQSGMYALRAAGRPASGALPAGSLTTAAIAAAERRAADLWSTDGAAGVPVQVADLPGDLLATTTASGITLDPNAAGFGWYIDPDVHTDTEFVRGADGRYRARHGSAADGRMDLVSVLGHELGHVLGRDDLDASAQPAALMADELMAGERRVSVGVDPGRDAAVLDALAAGRAFPIRAASAPPPDDTTPAPTVAAPDPAPATTVAAPDTTAAPATTVAAPDTTAAPATTAPPATTTPDTDPPAATTTIAAAPEPTTPDTTPAPTSTVAVADSETETTDAPASTSPAIVVIDQSAPSTSTVTNPPDLDTTPPTGTVPSSDGVDSTSSVGPGTVASVSTPLDGGGPGAVLGAPGTTIPAVAGGPVTLGLAPPAAVVSRPSTWAILLGFGANTLRFGADGSVSFGSETHWLDTIWNIDITGTAGDDSLTIALDAGAAPDVAVGYHGQGGADTLVGPTGGSWMSQWTVNGIDAGAGSLDVGDLAVDFDGVEHLVGGSGRDDFVLANTAPAVAASAAIATSTVTIDGGAGANSLHGPAFDTIWTIDGPDRGHVAGVGFENIGSLVGAPGNHDSFVIQPTGSVSGTIAGGTGGYDSIIANGGVDSVRYSIGQVYGDGVLDLDGTDVLVHRDGAGRHPRPGRHGHVPGLDRRRRRRPPRSVGTGRPRQRDHGHERRTAVRACCASPTRPTSSSSSCSVARTTRHGDEPRRRLRRRRSPSTVRTRRARTGRATRPRSRRAAAHPRPPTPMVTFAGDMFLDGGNIDVVARTITVKPGVTMSTVSSDPDGEDGYITFWARQFGVTVLEYDRPGIGRPATSRCRSRWVPGRRSRAARSSCSPTPRTARSASWSLRPGRRS